MSLPLADSEPEKPGNSWLYWTLCLQPFLVGLAMLIRFRHYNGFWIDELYTLHAINLPWNEMVLERLKRGHFPGYFALVKLLAAAVPSADKETLLRGFSVLCWGLCIPSFALLARRFLTLWPAVIAVIVFSLNNMVIRQASEARMYTLLLLVAIWIVRGWLELVNGNSKKRWSIGLPVLAFAAMAVSASTWMLLLGMLADANRRRRAQPTLLKVALASAIAAGVVLLPGAIMHLATNDRLGIAGMKPIYILSHAITAFMGSQTTDDYFSANRILRVVHVLAGILVIAGAVLLWRRRQIFNPVLASCLLIALLPFALMIITEILSEWTEFSLLGPPRYLMSIVPAAALVTGYAAAFAIQKLPRRGAVLLPPIALLLLSFGCYGMLTVRTEPFRERARLLARYYRPGDALVVVPHEIEEGVEMYAPGTRVDLAVNRWNMNEDQLRKKLQALKGHPAVWMVWYRGNASPVLDLAVEEFGAYRSSNQKKPIGGLRVYRFQPGKVDSSTTAPQVGR